MASYAWNKPFLSNGANLAFLKSAFQQVNGYQGNRHIASGDDVFLLEKFRKVFSNDIKYLKTSSAIVKTQTQKDWYSLLQQKVRWGSKTKNFQLILPKFIGTIVFLANISMLFCFALSLFDNRYFGLIFLKLIVDYLYISYINTFFKVRISLVYFVFVFLYYPIYFIRLTIFSIINSKEWKGRKI